MAVGVTMAVRVAGSEPRVRAFCEAVQALAEKLDARSEVFVDGIDIPGWDRKSYDIEIWEE